MSFASRHTSLFCRLYFSIKYVGHLDLAVSRVRSGVDLADVHVCRSSISITYEKKFPWVSAVHVVSP